MPSVRDFKPSEIVVEIATPKNANIVFKPLNMTLRGRWDMANCRGVPNPDSGYANMPTVPGLYVAVDPKNKTVRAVDPLGFDENADLLFKVQECAARDQGRVGPWPESRLDGQTESEIKTALWHVYSLVAAGKARPIKGTLPNKQEILGMPGHLLVRAGSTETVWDPMTGKPMPIWATDEEMAKLRGEPVAP